MASQIEVPAHDVLTTLFDALPVGVVVLDAAGRVVVYNRHEELLAGRSRERVLAKSFFEEVAPCLNVRELGGVFRARVASGTLDERVEVSFPFPHVERPRDVTVRLRSFVVGGEAHALLLVEDVSMQRAVERLKESLATLLVHDMKNPLSVITANLGYVGAKLHAAGLDDLRDAVAESGAAAVRLNGMILNLLDVTRLETGTFPLDPAPVDLAELARETVTALTPVARAQDVTLVADAPAVVPAVVDRAVVRRMLDNLIDNAIRHSPVDGRVVVSARAAHGRAELDVCDQGPGVPQELQERVFEKYVQVGGGRAQGMNRGLGLTFVRMAAHAHGGEATVVSSSSRGATFRLSLPDLAR